MPFHGSRSSRNLFLSRLRNRGEIGTRMAERLRWSSCRRRFSLTKIACIGSISSAVKSVRAHLTELQARHAEANLSQTGTPIAYSPQNRKILASLSPEHSIHKLHTVPRSPFQQIRELPERNDEKALLTDEAICSSGRSWPDDDEQQRMHTVRPIADDGLHAQFLLRHDTADTGESVLQ